MNWSEEEFKRVALNTRMTPRILAACYDVLVNGKSGVDAAAEHGVMTPQISRAKKALEEKKMELEETAENMLQTRSILKSGVVRSVRELMGDEMALSDAQPGEIYEGKVILKQDGFLVQQIGRKGVIHDLGKLSHSPDIQASVMIEYPRDNGFAVVKEAQPQAERRMGDRRVPTR